MIDRAETAGQLAGGKLSEESRRQVDHAHHDRGFHCQGGLDLDPALDPMALEGYVYGASGENENKACIIVQYGADGSLNTVYPEDKATQTLVYPAPGWSER